MSFNRVKCKCCETVTCRKICNCCFSDGASVQVTRPTMVLDEVEDEIYPYYIETHARTIFVAEWFNVLPALSLTRAAGADTWMLTMPPSSGAVLEVRYDQSHFVQQEPVGHTWDPAEFRNGEHDLHWQFSGLTASADYLNVGGGVCKWLVAVTFSAEAPRPSSGVYWIGPAVAATFNVSGCCAGSDPVRGIESNGVTGSWTGGTLTVSNNKCCRKTDGSCEGKSTDQCPGTGECGESVMSAGCDGCGGGSALELTGKPDAMEGYLASGLGG